MIIIHLLAQHNQFRVVVRQHVACVVCRIVQGFVKQRTGISELFRKFGNCLISLFILL